MNTISKKQKLLIKVLHIEIGIRNMKLRICTIIKQFIHYLNKRTLKILKYPQNTKFHVVTEQFPVIIKILMLVLLMVPY